VLAADDAVVTVDLCDVVPGPAVDDVRRAVVGDVLVVAIAAAQAVAAAPTEEHVVAGEAVASTRLAFGG
jgi:dihydroxyacetone kinase